MSQPPIMEIRRLTWPGGEELTSCTRISPTRFRVHFMTVTFPDGGGTGEPRPIPPSFLLDGVEVVRVTAGEEEYQQVELELELVHALEAIRFIPYRSYPLQRRQTSFESALELAEAVGFPVDQSSIVERADYGSLRYSRLAR